MNQRTHSWIAIRAIALLEDEKIEKNLVELLKPHARKASIGAWIPDQVDAKRGGAGSATENHILKMEPYTGTQPDRFITSKQELLKRIGMHRLTAQYIENDSFLDDGWWAKPYRGDVLKPGQHLANRIMALSTMMKDLLIMGDAKVDDLIPGKIGFTRQMDPESRTTEEAAAMYFFMLSHFVADISMPCHCDGRKLAGYPEGLHKELEAYWSKKVGSGFEKDSLIIDQTGMSESQILADSDQLLQASRQIGTKFNLTFSGAVPDLMKDQDVWLEVINLCRASFSIASIMAPYNQYAYEDKNARISFTQVQENSTLLSDIDQVVMHDAVLNTAIVWKHIWNKVSKE